MGAVAQIEVAGAKGGESKPKTAVESPDTLRSTNIAKILLAVGEGEFDGTPTDRDIYLDNTPLVDASGNVNFPGVKWEWRPGSIEQDYIQGIPAVENETVVNVELRSDNPFTRTLSNHQLSAVRLRFNWPRLARQDENGTFGYRVEYAIDVSTDGGAFAEALVGAVDGKTTTGYQRSERVNLPKAASGWAFRVRRITPNATSDRIADTMMIAGYTEIIDQKIRYPNTALLYIEFDAQQFQNIPTVTVDCKAQRWPVPSNYDPVGRTYSGVWDGTFKQAWTNNPVWATYGICVNDRFGLGKRIQPWMVDKWEMYRISQYCDQSVSNGVGGLEPRYLCDLNLQGRAEAWTLLRDLSAIYRGMVYWAQGSLYMQADMPRAQDIDYVFTRSNVIDGKFVYGGAGRDTHYSRALVSYDNPANNYDTDVIPVTDFALQRRYRDRPIEISAIGCTRASEAQRRGKWVLLSNSQDRTVTFKTGMEGANVLPGFVIPVADELVAGRPNGGRISAALGKVITLDRDTPIKAGDRLIVNLPNGTAQGRTVQSVAGRAVTVTTAYTLQPEPQLQWAIDYEDLAVQLFRVLKRTSADGGYEFTALEFNPSKFAAIDTGAKLDERPISVIPVTTVQPPASVSLSSNHMVDQGIAVNTMTIAWPAVQGAVAYDVEWRKDNGNWVSMQRTGLTSIDVTGIYAGAYLARVRAVSAFDITSIWKSSALTQLTGKEGVPPSVTFLRTESLLFGIKVLWGIPPGAEDTQRTELWYSEGTDLGAAIKLADLAYPQAEHTLMGLRAGQTFFFWARLVDRSGNVGPWFPVDGTVVNGQASSDSSPILEQIEGEILESHLGQQLTEKIEKIELIDGNGPGSVKERLGEVRTELGQQIGEVNNHVNEVQNTLQDQIDGIADLADSMPFKPDQTYTLGQSVLGEDGGLYQAKGDVPKETPPPNTAYWTDIGQAVRTAEGLAARVHTVETSVTDLNGELDATAKRVEGLSTSLDGKANADTVSSLASRVTQNEQGLSSQGRALTGLSGSLDTTNQNVTAAQKAASDAATLAGGKGKVIVQSAAPATADRLPQNLWIDTTNNANTPKRWNGTAWAAVSDKVATDAAAAAASALSQVATKADAAAVQALSQTVEQHGSAITANGQALTNVKASLSQAGGENLLFNPSFERSTSSPANVADGWVVRGSADSITPSLVDSTLRPGTKAQRVQASGLTSTTSTYADLAVGFANQPKVSEGQTLTLSTHVTGTPGLASQLFFQFKDSGGRTLSTSGGTVLAVDGTWQRNSSTSAPAPAGTVSVDVLLRTRTRDGSVTSGTIDHDLAQVELGGTMTGWRDNGQTGAVDIAANAQATEAIGARVTKTEEGLTSAAGQLTQLDSSIGDAGGENLLYNPAMTKYASLNGAAEGWQVEGSVSSIDTLIASWMNSSEKAQRIEVPSGLTTSGASSTGYKSLRNATSGSVVKRPKVAEGEPFTASAYARGTTGLACRIYLQWLTAAGSVISAPSSSLVSLSPASRRIEYSGVAPAGATECNVYYRVFSITGAVSGGYIELARPQVEHGARATGWSDNGQVTGAEVSANSKAIDSLNSSVEQHGADIKAVASRTTQLETSVNSPVNGLATRASASALENVSSRVSAAENGLTSQSGQLVDLRNNLAAVNAGLGAAGLDPAPDALWQFDDGVEGWTGAGCTLAAANGVMTVTATNNDPQIVRGSLAVVGRSFSLIRAKITRKAGTSSDWDGKLFYSTASHGQSGSYYKQASNPNLAIGASAVIEWDMAALTAGGNDWLSSTITQLRIDIGNTSGGAFDVDWIAVGRQAPSASSRALSSLDSKVTQQGTKIESEAKRTDGLLTSVGNAQSAIQNEAKTRADAISAQSQQIQNTQASLGNTNAAVQQISQAQAGTDGKINASYSVKLQVVNGNQYVATGFGLGLENNGGVLQSTFAVMADRFAILSPSGNGFVSPFAVQGGQVFLNEAFISTLTVQRALVGSSIASQSLAANGQPALNIDFNAGQQTFQSKTKSGNYMIQRDNGIYLVSGGVVMVEMSLD